MLEDEDTVYWTISEEMLEYAKSLEDKLQMNRTKESKVDTLTGILGELVFADFWYGDWKRENSYDEFVSNFGKPDFEGRFEVKSSCHKFDWKLNLLIRQDYNEKRIPPFYVQILFDTDTKEITTKTGAIIIGYTYGEKAHNGELKEIAGITTFKAYHTPFEELSPIYELKEILKDET